MANEQVTPDASARIHDLRGRILENQRLGRPASYGIKPEEVREGLQLCRDLFGSGAPAKKGSSKARVASNIEPAAPLDLNDLIPGFKVKD